MSRMMAFAAEHRDILNNQHPFVSHGVVEETDWEATVTLTRTDRDGNSIQPPHLSFVLIDGGEDLFEARLRLTQSYPNGRPLSSCNRPIGSIEAMTESIRDHLALWKLPTDCIDKEGPQALIAFVKDIHSSLGHTFTASLRADDYEETYRTG